MASIQIAQPMFLWLLLLIPLVIAAHFYFLQRTQRKALNFANFEAIKRIKGEKYVTKNITLLFMRIVVILGLVIGLSQLTLYVEGSRNDFDYVIALDTSNSMQASDLEPTRLAVAKSSANTFIDTLTTDTRVGFVEFSGVTYLRQTPTSNFIDLQRQILSTNISRTSGTDLAGAIITGTNAFTNEDRGKALIIFTDGVDTVGAFVGDNIIQATQYAQSKQVVIHAIGLGTENAPLGYLPAEFNLTQSVDENAIGFLANATGGSAFFPDTAEELETFFIGLDQQFQTAQIPIDIWEYGFIVAFLFLITEWVAFNFIFRRIA